MKGILRIVIMGYVNVEVHPAWKHIMLSSRMSLMFGINKINTFLSMYVLAVWLWYTNNSKY